MNVFEQNRPTQTLVEKKRRWLRLANIYYYLNLLIIPLELFFFLTSTPTPNHIVGFCVGMGNIFIAQYFLESSRQSLIQAIEEELVEGDRSVKLKLNCLSLDDRS